MAGIIGAIKKDLFHDGAKVVSGTKQHTYKALPKTVQELSEGGKEYTKDVAYPSHKLTDKLGKYVVSGGVIGSGSTMAFTAYENYREGKNLVDGLGTSALRGAALGTLPSYALDRYINGEDASIAPHLLTGAVFQAASAGHMISMYNQGTRELAKNTAKTAVKAVGDVV